MKGGWDESAAAWIASMGERGDWGREFVLDAPMLTGALGLPDAAFDLAVSPSTLNTPARRSPTWRGC